MNIYDSSLYISDLNYVANINLPWKKIQGKSILISGATGLIGSFLIDVIMKKNEFGLNCMIYAICRNKKRAIERFNIWKDNKLIKFIYHDINYPLENKDIKVIDYVLHLASNTHPVQYSSDPIGTISTNIIGLQNMLNFAVDHNALRFAFSSSNEIYGENRGDVEFFDESYCGYINSNTLRAGYPESKRCGEALCNAYKQQKKLNIVIPRLTRSYGPTMLLTDTKAISQFIKKGILGDDIVLKSEGNQYYSYTYVADAVAGVLFVLLEGENGEAYNIADEQSDIRLRELAGIIAKIAHSNVVFEIPDELEKLGYSSATKARLNGNKLKKLGWRPIYNIEKGIERTMNIFRGM